LPLIGVPVAAVFAAFGLVIYLAYGQAMPGSTAGEPPLIKAAATPFKVAPDDPGGRAIVDLGAVGNLLGEEPQPVGEERLLPAPEQPLSPAEALPVGLTTRSFGDRDGGGQGAGGSTALPSDAQLSRNAEQALAELARQVEEQAAALAKEPLSSLAGTTAGSAAPAPATTAAATPAATPTTVRPAVAEGRYRIQLAAVREETDAQRAWAIYQRDFGATLAGITPFFERADTENGVFYRVQIGPFAEVAEADRLCAELKQRSASCFVVSR
jgi:cell division septation protein DedD